jgi:FkbM family methyltransferase
MSMSSSLLFAHPRVIAWRNRLRKNTWLRGIYGTLATRGDYEARFARELLAAVRKGDTVWDVGANVGVYAAQFAERGAASVVCFEPAPAAVEALQRRFPAVSPQTANPVRIVPIALSNQRGTALFSADGASPNNQIGGADRSKPTIEIQVRSADEAQAEFALPTPNVVKIDVEGYELEVVEGAAQVLSSKHVRSVFIEVHFALLHARKLDEAPATILRMLRQHGFAVRWVDPSHIGAHRP